MGYTKDIIKGVSWISALRGITRGSIIALVILISAHFIASFFNAPNSLSLLLLISIVPLIRGFINPAIILFQKNLNFNKEFYFRSTILAVEVLVSVFLVYLLRSPTGLIFGMIASAI